MQVWESDASEHLAFGSDAGAKECEPDGQAQGGAQGGEMEERERGVGLRSEEEKGCDLSGWLFDRGHARWDGTMHRGVC